MNLTLDTHSKEDIELIEFTVDNILATPFPNKATVTAHVTCMANSYIQQINALARCRWADLVLKANPPTELLDKHGEELELPRRDGEMNKDYHARLIKHAQEPRQ